MNSKTANNINILGQFCGMRDMSELSQEELTEKYGIKQADVMVLISLWGKYPRNVECRKVR